MRQLQITPLDGYDPEIGRWMWALQDVRRRYTLRLVKDLDERLVDWEGPDGQENAIGSLLYHIAQVEMGWLFGDVKQMTELPPAVKPDFPFPSREPARNHLTRVLGMPLAEHIGRLDRSREVFLREFAEIPPGEWRRLRRPPDFEEVNYEGYTRVGGVPSCRTRGRPCVSDQFTESQRHPDASCAGGAGMIQPVGRRPGFSPTRHLRHHVLRAQ